MMSWRAPVGATPASVNRKLLEISSISSRMILIDRGSSSNNPTRHNQGWRLGRKTIYKYSSYLFFCVCYAPDLVGALTGIRVNSASRWNHWFPRRYSQEGRARVDPGFLNADAILPILHIKNSIQRNPLYRSGFLHSVLKQRHEVN